MAVNTSNTNTTTNEKVDQSFQQQSDFNQQQYNQGQSMNATPNANTQQQTTNGFRSFAPNKISRSAAIEAVNAFMEIGQKVIDNNGQSQEYKLVRIPDERTRIPLPVIALFKTFSVNGFNTTVVRPIIYGTEPLGARKAGGGQNGFGGFNSEIDVESAPGDAYTDQLWNSIVLFLREQCGITHEIIDANCFAVPQHFVPDEAKMTVVIANAVTMIESWANLRLKPDVSDISPEFFAKGKTEARMDFNPKQIFDSVGNPIRADWAVAVTYQEHNQQGSADDFTNTRTPVVNVYGYIDLVLTNGAQQPQQNGFMYGMPPQAPYTPLLVITHIESDLGLLTPGMVLLGLHGMTAIIENRNYTRAFRPRNNPKMKRTIAALALETPWLNTTGTAGIPDLSSDDKLFFQFLQNSLNAAPLIAIDIEETGDNNTVTSILREVAASNQKAVEMLTRSANILTNGQFGQAAARHVLQPNAICQSDDNRIALGHYTVEGNAYDRREVDKLAMLTVLGPTDMTTVQQFDETMNNFAIPSVVRLAQNWSIVNSCLQSTSPVTGYARRIILSGKFLTVVNESIRAAGINVTLNGGQFDGQTQRGRDYATIQSMAYQTTGNSFTQANSFGGFGQGMGGFGQRTGW